MHIKALYLNWFCFFVCFPPSDQLLNKLGKKRKTGLICSPFGPNSCLYTPDASSSSRLRLILSPRRSPFCVALWSNNSSNLLGREGGNKTKELKMRKTSGLVIRIISESLYSFIFFSECLLMMIPFWCLFWFCWVCFARCHHTHTHTQCTRRSQKSKYIHTDEAWQQFNWLGLTDVCLISD